MKTDCYDEFVLHGAYLAQITEGGKPGTKAAAVAMGKLDGYCEAAEIIGFAMTPFAFKLGLLEALRKVGPMPVTRTTGGTVEERTAQRKAWGEKFLASFSVVA